MPKRRKPADQAKTPQQREGLPDLLFGQNRTALISEVALRQQDPEHGVINVVSKAKAALESATNRLKAFGSPAVPSLELYEIKKRNDGTIHFDPVKF